MEPATGAGLVRAIRRWDLVALIINFTIGAGIFGLPSKLYALTGTYSLLAFVVCAAFILLLILCFAEMGSRFAETGGPYLYARAAFGPIVGFQVGWLMWLARLTSFAALCNLLVGYLGYFWPGLGSGTWRAILLATLVAALAVVNITGVRHAAFVNNLFTVGKLVPLLLFVAAGLFFLNPQSYSFATPPGYASFSKAVLLLVYAFTGFEMAVIPAGEALDPRRNIPFALLAAIGVVVLLYVLIQVVCIGTLPELAHSERPLADAGSRILGAAGASIMTAGALISIIGTLNAIMLAAPRLLYAMAEQSQLPRLLSATHPRFRTPHVAILISAAVMLALALSATFIAALTISTIIRLITYVATCLALLVLRRNDAAGPVTFTAPGGAAVSIAALALSVWLLSNSTWSEALFVGAAAALGFLIHLVFRFSERAGKGVIGG